MAKKGKKGNSSNEKSIDKAIEKDERFSGIMKDPRFHTIHSKKVSMERDDRFKFEKKNKKENEKKKDVEDKEQSSEESEEFDYEYLQMLARGEIDVSESSSESEDEALMETTPEEKNEEEEEVIEDGEATHRFACVNMNWDNVTATDLLSVFKSFAQGGSVYSVTIYPSEYGKKRLKEEELYGPEGRIVEEHDFVDDEEIEEEEKVDEDRLRKYEKERLRYYFAVVDCDNKFTANLIYDQTDGTEFLRSGSIFDLRFIPDDMVFDNSSIKDKATFVPENYTPASISYGDVNSHSNVQLSWDQEDKRRVNELVKGRSTRKNEKGEIDYSNYLASSDEESSDENEESIRERYKSILQVKGEEDEEEEENEEEEGDADITFIPGLKQSLKQSLEEKKKEEEKKNSSMNVYEAYKQKLKEKRKQKGKDIMDEEEGDEEEGLFANLEEDKKQKKQKKQKKRKEETEEEKKKRAELELLMIDEGTEDKHNYDMNEIKKSIKQSEKKSKKRGKEIVKDDFEINTEDERFKGLVTNSDFSIDVTNPLYIKTKGMEKLVNSVTKRRRKE